MGDKEKKVNLSYVEWLEQALAEYQPVGYVMNLYVMMAGVRTIVEVIGTVSALKDITQSILTQLILTSHSRTERSRQ